MRAFLPGACLLLAAACGEGTGPDPAAAVRTVLYYREDTGQNYLLNSDGTAERIATTRVGLIPIGLSNGGNELAFLQGNALVIGNLEDAGRFDTLLHPIPGQISPVTFAPGDQSVAVFKYGTHPALLILHRAGPVDTLFHGEYVPDLPPAFSPDGSRLALLSVTELSVVVTVVSRGVEPLRAGAASFSRFIFRPRFGWPRWTERGLLLATVREGEDADTVAVLLVNPDDPQQITPVEWELAAPTLFFDAGSSYALSADGLALVFASPTAQGGPRRLYYGARGQQLRSLLTDGSVRPAFPLLLP
ncbi:MAG: hypothetical protein WD934_05355 [Gemmatimonadales bacterium]